MMDRFVEVQGNFMELGILLSGYDLDKDLHKEDVLDNIDRALNKTYASFAEGLCDEVQICSKCEQTSNELCDLVERMRVCTNDKSVDEQTHTALVAFSCRIPQVLSELKSVYLEMLSNRKS